MIDSVNLLPEWCINSQYSWLKILKPGEKLQEFALSIKMQKKKWEEEMKISIWMCCLPGASQGRCRFGHLQPGTDPQKAASVYKSVTTQRSYCRAASWSWTSTVPSLWWTACRIFWPWNPLPRPSRRATMTPCKPTSTESQPREKRSLTAWPPGALSLFSPVENTHTMNS